MMRVATFTFAFAWALVLAAPAVSARTLSDAPRSCDPTRELEAAERAAAAGDQAAALEHLLRADAILAACEQDPAKAGPTLEPESPERAFAHGSGPGGSLGCG